VAVGFSRFDITGNFSQFSGSFLVPLQHTCFYEIILHIFITADYFFTDKSTLTINILLSEHKSGQIRQAANSLLLAREHSPDVNNKPMQSVFLIWNNATVGTLQYSILKWNFDSRNAICSRLMKVVPK